MTTTTRGGPRRHRLIAAAAGATVAALLIGVLAVTRAAGHHWTPTVEVQNSDPAPNRASPTPPGPARTSLDPTTTLERLAADLTGGVPDPARAKFEYIDVRVWESSDTQSTTPPGTGPGRRIHLWTTGSGNSRVVTTDDARGCQPERDETSDELGPFDGPLSSDPDAVRRQILHEPLPPDAVPDVFGQIAGLFTSRFVPLRGL